MADGNITVEVSTQAAQAELERLRAENAALKREAHAWWTAARDATVAERKRCARRVVLHSQYPIETDYDRGYDQARKDAAETLRNMSAYELNQVTATPEQRALTGDVFDALDLRPEQFLTEGGLVNRGKLRAAFWYPQDYLPEGHWMRAADRHAEAAASWRDAAEDPPRNGQEVLATIYPYRNKINRQMIVHAVYVDAVWLDPADLEPLHEPTHWMPAPALPDGA